MLATLLEDCAGIGTEGFDEEVIDDQVEQKNSLQSSV